MKERKTLKVIGKIILIICLIPILYKVVVLLVIGLNIGISLSSNCIQVQLCNEAYEILNKNYVSNNKIYNYETPEKFMKSFFQNENNIKGNFVRYNARTNFKIVKFQNNCHFVDLKNDEKHNQSDCIMLSYSTSWGTTENTSFYYIDGLNNIIYPSNETKKKIKKAKVIEKLQNIRF